MTTLRWILVLNSMLLVNANGTLSQSIVCTQTRVLLISNGYSEAEVPYQQEGTPVPGGNLQLCARTHSCCTEALEKRWSEASVQRVGHTLHDLIHSWSKKLGDARRSLDGQFREILRKSGTDLHTMFVRTYGKLYQDNAELFSRFFDELQRSYGGRRVRVEESVDDLFRALFIKSTALIDRRYEEKSELRQCVESGYDTLQPFGETPKVVALQLRRSVTAAKTLIYVLDQATRLVDEWGHKPLEHDQLCQSSVRRLLTCAVCAGLPEQKVNCPLVSVCTDAIQPCLSSCLDVLRGCLSSQASLNTEWNGLIDALVKLSDRLGSAFSLELVVQPLNVKISDAIMTFQEKMSELQSKLETHCGTSSGKKRNFIQINKRDVDEPFSESTQTEPVLRQLRDDLRKMRDFPLRLPQSVCAPLAEANRSTPCWHDTAQLDPPQPSSLRWQKHVDILQDIANWAKLAAQGEQVENVGLEDDEDLQASGSGSGEASGDQEHRVEEQVQPETAPTHEEDFEWPLLHPQETHPQVQIEMTRRSRGAGATVLPSLALLVVSLGGTRWCALV